MTGKAMNVPTPCFILRTAKKHKHSMMVLAESCLPPLFLSRLDPWLYRYAKGVHASLIVERDGMGDGGDKGGEWGWGGHTVYVSVGDVYVGDVIYEPSLPDNDQSPQPQTLQTG